MENWGKWKLIKVGFWLGIGFIIPELIVMYSGTAATMMAMSSIMDTMTESVTESNDSFASFKDKFDKASEIKIQQYREQMNGRQLLILGSVVNNSNSKVRSIELEAELTDENGVFVYECTEYISKNFNPGEAENFQIKCGCGDNPIPKYENIVLRVVSASYY